MSTKLCLAIYCIALLPGLAAAQKENCLSCHEKQSPMVVEQWRDSKHGQNEIGCLACHDPELTKTIVSDRCPEKVAVVVSPTVCANCHEDEVSQQKGTKHATTLHFFVNVLEDPWTVKGANSDPERAIGCYMCHGSIVKDKTDWINWPNNGVGRLNPDGSLGTCTVRSRIDRLPLGTNTDVVTIAGPLPAAIASSSAWSPWAAASCIGSPAGRRSASDL